MTTMMERYNNDPMFRQLVDTLVHFIEQGQMTPMETREAAMVAQIIYEDRHPRPMIFTREQMIQGKV
jgi:hypothetical protein